jgi:hypothetical protein
MITLGRVSCDRLHSDIASYIHAPERHRLVTRRPVSKAVNSVKNNRPELLELI